MTTMSTTPTDVQVSNPSKPRYGFASDPLLMTCAGGHRRAEMLLYVLETRANQGMA